MSQFHYGSIQTEDLLLPLLEDSSVTIPLWFDSNLQLVDLLLGAVSVTIPLWFDSNDLKKEGMTLIIRVTIPLWFDSNIIKLGNK